MYSVEYFDRGSKKKEDFVGTEREIRERLSAEGKVVLEIKPAQIAVFSRRRVSSKEICAVLNALGDLLSAGVPLTQSMQSVVSSLDPASGMRRILLTMAGGVKEGRDLSKVMDGYRKEFGFTTISMVRAGEGSGRLAESLLAAAEHRKTVDKIKKEMVQKLTYPAVVFFVGVVALLFNTNIVIPKIMNSDLFKMTLKGETNGFLSILDFLSIALPVLIGIIIIAGIVGASLYRAKQEQIEEILLRAPLVRELIFYRSFYIAFYSLSKLLLTGVRLDIALGIVSKSTNVITVCREFQKSLELLKAGSHFARGLKHIDPVERIMLETAQNSEKIHQNLMIVSNRYYDQYVEKIKALAPKVYGLTLVFVGIVFILTFFGIMVPYTKLIGGIG